MIRLPEIPGLQASPINAPQVRPGAAALPAVALGDLAKELSGVSEHFHEHAVNLQKIDNARRISEIRQQFVTELAQNDVDLQREPDPARRIQKTREFIDSAKVRILDNADLPPAARDQLTADFTETANRAFIGQIQDSARLTTKRAALALENEINAAKRTGDRQLFTKAINTGTEAGVIVPEQIERLSQDFDRSLASQTLDLAIQDDPALVLQDIERPDFFQRMPGLSQEDVPHIRRAAEQSAQRHRAEQLDLIQEALLQKKLTPADIEAADYLKAEDRAEIRRALERDAAPTPQPLSAEEHGKAWDTLLSLREAFTDPEISDSQYAARFNDTRARVLSVIANTPEAFRGDITGELARRSPANRSAEKLLPAVGTDKAELKAIALDRVTRARTAGMFGNVAEDAPPAEREKAYRRAEAIRLQISQHVERNADKIGLPEIESFTDSLISGDRIKSNARDFRPFIPGSAQRLRPVPALPVLPPKQGTKDKATPDPLQIPPGDGTASADLLPSRQLETFLNP